MTVKVGDGTAMTVRELADRLRALPADLQDAPVAVYSEADEGGDIVTPGERSIVVERADDEDSLLYHKSDNPVSWRHIPVLVTITG